jgi:prepilin-type N-terminal cleavage/methylation domain-containing protein
MKTEYKKTLTRAALTGRAGFTLIELLIVVAIIAILAAIGLVNFRMASNRALKAADASNLHTIATALQTYLVDYGTLPPADSEAGPFMSHGYGPLSVGNAPAAGGSWDGVPWLLYTTIPRNLVFL